MKYLCIQSAALADDNEADQTFKWLLLSVYALSPPSLCSSTRSKMLVRVAIANSGDDIT
jgi:hypothetical protein